MGWSWRIGRIAGIDVYVHPTFLLLLAWVAISKYFAHNDLAEAIYGLVFILALFGIVILHELGHALTARHYGIRTRDITLLPIGGVARLERIPEIPSQELAVAVAGPAVNVVLAALIYLGLAAAGQLGTLNEVLKGGGGFMQQLFWVNVSLVVFNMVPAFPMDGGRVFATLLAMRFEYVKATQIAASVGQAIALLFGLLGLSYNPLLIFIALFVWFAGAQEAGFVQIRSALGSIPVKRAMITAFRTLQPDDRLKRPSGMSWPVSSRISRSSIMASWWASSPVTTSRPRWAGTVRIIASATSCNATSPPPTRTKFSRPHSPGSRTGILALYPWCADGRLLGLLTADNLAEVLMIQEALREAHRPGLFGGPRRADDRGPKPMALHPQTGTDES